MGSPNHKPGCKCRLCSGLRAKGVKNITNSHKPDCQCIACRKPTGKAKSVLGVRLAPEVAKILHSQPGGAGPAIERLVNEHIAPAVDA